MIPTILVVEDNPMNLIISVRRRAITSVSDVSEADRVRFTVTDSGPGIPAEFRGKIFEKFGQAPLGQAVGVRSSGLGLTFCKLAVEAHRGKIGMESAETGGARFWVELFRVAART